MSAAVDRYERFSFDVNYHNGTDTKDHLLGVR
jgi:hypothetical protein